MRRETPRRLDIYANIFIPSHFHIYVSYNEFSNKYYVGLGLNDFLAQTYAVSTYVLLDVDVTE